MNMPQSKLMTNSTKCAVEMKAWQLSMSRSIFLSGIREEQKQGCKNRECLEMFKVNEKLIFSCHGMANKLTVLMVNGIVVTVAY